MRVWTVGSRDGLTVTLIVPVTRFAVPTVAVLAELPAKFDWSEVTYKFVPASVEVTVPAGTVIGAEQELTGIVTLVENPGVEVVELSGSVRLNWKFPVRPDPAAGYLQTSTVPLTSASVKVTVEVVVGVTDTTAVRAARLAAVGAVR